MTDWCVLFFGKQWLVLSVTQFCWTNTNFLACAQDMCISCTYFETSGLCNCMRSCIPLNYSNAEGLESLKITFGNFFHEISKRGSVSFFDVCVFFYLKYINTLVIGKLNLWQSPNAMHPRQTWKMRNKKRCMNYIGQCLEHPQIKVSFEHLFMYKFSLNISFL